MEKNARNFCGGFTGLFGGVFPAVSIGKAGEWMLNHGCSTNMWRGNVEVKRRTLDLPEGEAVVVIFDEVLQQKTKA